MLKPLSICFPRHEPYTCSHNCHIYFSIKSIGFHYDRFNKQANKIVNKPRKWNKKKKKEEKWKVQPTRSNHPWRNWVLKRFFCCDSDNNKRCNGLCFDFQIITYVPLFKVNLNKMGSILVVLYFPPFPWQEKKKCARAITRKGMKIWIDRGKGISRSSIFRPWNNYSDVRSEYNYTFFMCVSIMLKKYHLSEYFHSLFFLPCLIVTVL